MDVNQKAIPDRRRWARHKVHTPAFASFDGVTGGVILDLSEQGMSMQTSSPIEAHHSIQLHLNLSEPTVNLETTGYIAWADALGRAGVRFSELPEESRVRLQQWLAVNDAAPSRKAPKVSVGETTASGPGANLRGNETRESLTLSLEPQTNVSENINPPATSTTVQYEFNSLGSDLNASLRLISERARSLTRATGAAIALAHHGSMMCRASVGSSAPALGSRLDVNSGFSGECVRGGLPMRCDDAESDPRVDIDRCRQLGIRSILAAPIQYQREIIGLLEVFSTSAFAFDEGDVAVVERLAQTVVLTMSHASTFNSL